MDIQRRFENLLLIPRNILWIGFFLAVLAAWVAMYFMAMEIGFFLAVLAAWVAMYFMAMEMDLNLIGQPGPKAEAMRLMDPGMDMRMPMAEYGPLFAMWATMMAAMMLPTMVPALKTYEDIIVAADGSWGGWSGVLTGYGLMWILFAAIITAVQLALLHGGIIDMLGILKSSVATGMLLIGVGAFQFSRVKQICHGICHAPITYYLSTWRPGFCGGVRMGLGMGTYCVFCCWGIMALGFAGGVMNLLWMGLATIFMVLEKLPQFGRRIMRPAGALLIIGGMAVIAISLVNRG